MIEYMKRVFELYERKCITLFTLSLLTLLCEAHIEKKDIFPDNIGLDPYKYVALDKLQETIISNERHLALVYGDEIEQQLAGLCLRAFYIWVCKLTDCDLMNFYVVNINEGFCGEYIKLDYQSTDEVEQEEFIDEDDEDGIEAQKKHKLYREYYDRVAFNYIIPYQSLNPSDFLQKKSIIANVKIIPHSPFGTMDVIINAFIPCVNYPLHFKHVKYYYEFGLKLNGGPKAIETWNNEQIGSVRSNPYYVINKNGFINLEALLRDNFTWELSRLTQINDNIVDFTKEPIPPTLNDLFFESN